MSWNKGRTSGWAAFDLKQRQKQGLEPPQGNSDDPYPPIASSRATLWTCSSSTKPNNVSTRSFSSLLVRPPVNFPSLTDSEVANSRDLAIRQLKELHSWADSSLVDDVLEAVSNNIYEASNILESMVSSQNSEGDKERNNGKQTISFSGSASNVNSDRSDSLGNHADIENRLRLNYNQLKDVYASCGKMLSDGTSDTELIVERLRSIPAEPEWEEDDVYLIHRKDAIRMMRSASQHSKAATNAFLRGDHISAQKHSQKAQEEWSVAENLNRKAAKQILSIRNSNNDMWILDLHGLHASEAAQALQERLHEIEKQASKNRSVSPTRVRAANGILRSSSQESLSHKETEHSYNHFASFRQRTTSLTVITGVGNHSRGEAALPTAVRNFLNENRYRYEEPRPGVITVKPKFWGNHS
ncbi:hypothetical protein ACFE04_019369 [Oxalis oulophora]